MARLTFAIDFDDTYTAAPLFWDRFICHAIGNDHSVYIVTARRDTEINRAVLNEIITSHHIDHSNRIFTALKPKAEVMEQRGIKVNIWIDDNPGSIVNGIG